LYLAGSQVHILTVYNHEIELRRPEEKEKKNFVGAVLFVFFVAAAMACKKLSNFSRWMKSCSIFNLCYTY
jgi:hypothetical protein